MSHPESLAVRDSFFAMSWMAAVDSKVLAGVSWFHIQVGDYSSTFTVLSKKDTLSLDHSVVNLMVGCAG